LAIVSGQRLGPRAASVAMSVTRPNDAGAWGAIRNECCRPSPGGAVGWRGRGERLIRGRLQTRAWAIGGCEKPQTPAESPRGVIACGRESRPPVWRPALGNLSGAEKSTKSLSPRLGQWEDAEGFGKDSHIALSHICLTNTGPTSIVARRPGRSSERGVR
jgi:hypothetical protein